MPDCAEEGTGFAGDDDELVGGKSMLDMLERRLPDAIPEVTYATCGLTLLTEQLVLYNESYFSRRTAIS